MQEIRDPNLKGNIAEAVIATEALKLGVEVFRPAAEHGRVDLVFAKGRGLWRVQCKWGSLSARGTASRLALTLQPTTSSAGL